MKKVIFLVFVLLSASIFFNPVNAQSTTNESTIKMKDGRIIHGEIESITYKTFPEITYLNKQTPARSKKRRLLITGDSLSFLKTPQSLFKSFSSKSVYLGVETAQDDKGARIVQVIAGSPAEKAGLMKDDIITKVEDKKIDGPEKLAEVIRGMKADQKVKISILRDGKKKVISAVLGVQDTLSYQNTPFQLGDSLMNPRSFRFFYNMPNPYKHYNMPNENFRRFQEPREKLWGFPPVKKQGLGLQIQDTEDESGVTILNVERNSPAEKAGVKEGDLLTEINDSKITSVNDVMQKIRQTKGNEYKLQLMRNKKPVTITVKIPKKLRKADI